MFEQPLEEAAHLAADLFVEVYRGLERRVVQPAVLREDLEHKFAGTVTEEGIGLVAALSEFERDVLPASMGTAHPLYLGLVNSSPLPGAALADLLISALNNNGGAFHQSPAMSACEREVVRAFVRLFGQPEDTDGMFLPGGTFANLQGIVLARSHATGGPPHPGLRVYTSAAAHFSVARAALVAGISPAAIVSIETEGRGSMSVRSLAERIRSDRSGGATPCAVVATLGTTGTGATDSLAAIAELCEAEKIWLHVDACYGGAAMLVPRLRPVFLGIERADSISIDPHKWFFIPVTAALFLTRHGDLAHRTFEASGSSYIPQDGAIDPWRRGIPTTRRSSGFAVWMALRAHGLRTIREAVERNIALIRLLEKLLAVEGFRVLEGGELSIACARFEPNTGGVPVNAGSMDPDPTDAGELDSLQEGISRAVNASGRAWFSTVRHAGQIWLRFNLVNLHTREHHIRELAALVADAAITAITRWRSLRPRAPQ